MQVGLLRHGEVEGGACFRGSTDDLLTGRGWQQMWDAVAEANPPWRLIVASPLARCAAFAQRLARRRGLPLSLDERLREMHFGTWEGRTAAELMAADAGALERFWRDPVRHGPPGAEPLTDFRARVLSVWHEIQGRHADEDVLLVTHGGVIRVLLCHFRGHPLERLLDFEVGHGTLQRIRVECVDGRPGYAI